jgi:uncharacterized OB-fold protein
LRIDRHGGASAVATGPLWAWTTQEFPPPSPPYTGPTGDAFVSYGVGYVELGNEVRGRDAPHETEGLRIGMDMELVLVPFRTDAMATRS